MPKHGIIRPKNHAALKRRAQRRLDFWASKINEHGARTVVEIGVFRGEFAEGLLSRCAGIERYFLIDPWRHLDDWNKPANAADAEFEGYLAETRQRIAPWQDKCVILRGRTTDVIAEVPDASVDFAYVDGDHTLRGITIDLLRLWPKMAPGGLIGGDDFSRTIWQHNEKFEPTLVFPWVVHFAEAHDVLLEAFPSQQFALHTKPEGFRFVDHTGSYPEPSLREAVLRRAPERSAERSIDQPPT